MELSGTLFFALKLAAAVAGGLMAGVFFTFSSFVMRGLSRLPPEEGMEAMQAINLAALRPPFLTLFLGGALIAAAAVAASLLRWGEPGSAALLAGGALHLLGSFFVTAAANVPRNQRLAKVRRGDPDAQAVWGRYLAEWTAWNHVRTIVSLAAAVGFALALAG
jgi:uncharacterized membrane protein